MAILKDVVKQIKKYAKAGTKLATFPVTKLAKTYKASDFKKAFDTIASTPIPDLNNQKGIIDYWQAMCNNYDKNYDKVFKKYYEKHKSELANVKKTGVAAVFVGGLNKLFTMTKKTQDNNSYVEEIKEKLNKRVPWLKNATPNGLKNDIDNTLNSLNISRPNVSENKDITIEEYFVSILDDQKVLKAICSLNNKLNLLFIAIDKTQNSQPHKSEQETKSASRVPLPPVKADPAIVNFKPKAAASAPSIDADVLKKSIGTVFDGLQLKGLSDEQEENVNAVKKYFKDNAEKIFKIIDLPKRTTSIPTLSDIFITKKALNNITNYEKFKTFIFYINNIFNHPLVPNFNDMISLTKAQTPPPRKPEQETPQANPKANQNSTAPATKQSNQSSPPSISDNLKRSIETFFNGLQLEGLTDEEEKNVNAVKKYFKDNAQDITNKIMDLKDSKNREAWINYFIGMPFSQKMVYKEFENSIYGKIVGNDGLFREMGKYRIKPDAITPKSLPKGVKLPPQKQQFASAQPTRVATSAHSQANGSGRPLPKPNPPKNTMSAPSNKQQQPNSNKAIEVANVAAAVTAARASAATAEEAAAKAKQLATDTSTAENAENAQQAAKNAENAQQAAKIVKELAEDIAKIVNDISAKDLKEYVKNANEAAERAKEFAELAKKFAGITDDDDEYDD